jgi:GNAT superfamily N-acetyltransferase
VPPWEIRLANSTDAASLCEAIDQYRIDVGAQSSTHSDEDSASFVRHLLGSECARVFISVKDCRVIGFLLFTYSATAYHLRSSIQVVDLWVEGSWRRLGLATALMHAIEDHARTVRAKSLYLTMEPSRPYLRAFYSALGFQLVDLLYLRRLLPATNDNRQKL